MARAARSARAARWLTAALVALLAFTGCGVPDDSDPVRLGVPRQQAGNQDQGTGTPPGTPPRGPEGVTDVDELLRLYLQASAWGNSTSANRPTAVSDAEQLVRRFIDPAQSQEWRPTERFALVRVTWQTSVARVGPGPFTIPARVETVGVLNANGSIAEPDPATARVTDHQFTVRDIGNGQLRVVNPLPGMVFDVEQILTWYHQRTVYFYSGDGQSLIPDVRYMPKAVGVESWPGEVLRWLLAGPSDWLRPVAAPIPDRIALSGNVVVDSPALIDINLTAEAAGLNVKQLEAFQIQVRWSLGGQFNTPDPQVRLRIEQSQVALNVPDQTYRQANPAVANQGVDPPRFCVLSGQIRPVQGGPVPLLDAERNRDVVSGSIAANRRAVAYIRSEATAGRGGQQRLWIATGPTGQGDTGQSRHLPRAAFRTMGRPVWLDPGGQGLLVVGNEELHLASAADEFAKLTPLGVGRVSSVAVAPDGRRIAYVADGRVFVALVRIDGNDASLVQRRELLTPLVRQTAVAWLTQDRVVVAGQSAAGSPIREMSIDGTQLRPVVRTGLEPALQISKLVAFPDAPNTDSRYLMMIEAGGVAYNVFGGEIGPLGCRADAQPSPSAGTSPTGGTAQATAPFFLG